MFVLVSESQMRQNVRKEFKVLNPVAKKTIQDLSLRCKMSQNSDGKSWQNESTESNQGRAHSWWKPEWSVGGIEK